MFIKFAKKYWYLCLLTSIMVIAETVVDLWQPSLMADIVDNGVLSKNFPVIWQLGIKMILIVLAGGITGIFGSIFGNMAGQNVGCDIRKALFEKTMHLSPEQANAFSSASLINRLSDDVTRVSDSIKVAFRGVARYAFMLLGGIYMLYSQSHSFAITALCALPVLIFFVIFFLGRSTKMFADVQKKLDGVTGTMQEDIRAGRVIKTYNKESHESERFEKANSALFSSSLKVQRFLAFLSPCMNIVLNLCVCAIILIGGISVNTDSAIAPGRVMAGITYFAIILTGASVLGNLSQTFIRAKTSWSRIKEVLESTPSITDGSYDQSEKQLKGDLELKNVSFAYPDAASDALNDISFHVKQGQTLGIIGSTGCGKTTLANLIVRFFDPKEGSILLDGVNIKDYRLKDLRNSISYILQSNEMFSRSISENIAWGNEKASEADIKKAAEVSQAFGFINEMPEGFNTLLTEEGHSVSGGQKQRLAIARAIVKPSEILIMDDSTSALDLKTEADLYSALNADFPDLTKIIISTRVASIKDADIIAVMDKGKIIALGSHSSLKESCRVYRDIYDSQMKGGAYLG